MRPASSNHPDRAMGDGWRYGSEALVLNGSVFDVYRGMGESNEPQSMNAGPTRRAGFASECPFLRLGASLA